MIPEHICTQRASSCNGSLHCQVWPGQGDVLLADQEDWPRKDSVHKEREDVPLTLSEDCRRFFEERLRARVVQSKSLRKSAV